jgi:hypothetical protein
MSTYDFRPKKFSIYAYAGDDLTFDIPVTDATGAPEDLTGATAKAQILTQHGSADPAVDFTAVVGADKITLSLPAASTQTLPPSAVWDCQVTFAGPPVVVRTVAAGSITTAPGVTGPAAAATGGEQPGAGESGETRQGEAAERKS